MRTNVTFDSAGLKIAGHLYTPDNGAAGPRPAIVVGHPGSGVAVGGTPACITLSGRPTARPAPRTVSRVVGE
jgi:hypothetical protein